MRATGDVLVLLLVCTPLVLWPLMVPPGRVLGAVEALLAVLATVGALLHFDVFPGAWSATFLLGYVPLVAGTAGVGLVVSGSLRAPSGRLAAARVAGACLAVAALPAVVLVLLGGLAASVSGPDVGSLRLPGDLRVVAVGDPDCGSSSCSVWVSVEGANAPAELAELDGTCQRFGPWHRGEQCVQADGGGRLLLSGDDWI